MRLRITFFSTALLLLAASAFGQTRGFLKIAVIDGDGAFNDIKNKIGHPPAVEVRDESNDVVAGAEVVFTMPALGPGGAFANGQRSMNTHVGRSAPRGGSVPGIVDRACCDLRIPLRGIECSNPTV